MIAAFNNLYFQSASKSSNKDSKDSKGKDDKKEAKDVGDGAHVDAVSIFVCTRLVLLRFSKSGKRTVSDGFVKKSADSDSVLDSRGRHYKLIYTGRRRAQCLSTGGGKCGDDAPLRRSFLAGKTQPQANVPCARHTLHARTHARTWTSDVAR